MSDDQPMIPIACNPQALGAAEWEQHQIMGRALFQQQEAQLTELVDGFALSVPVDRLGDLATFVDRERRCCPFFHFAIEVPPAAVKVVLRITGSPEAKAVLAAELE